MHAFPHEASSVQHGPDRSGFLRQSTPGEDRRGRTCCRFGAVGRELDRFSEVLSELRDRKAWTKHLDKVAAY